MKLALLKGVQRGVQVRYPFWAEIENEMRIKVLKIPKFTKLLKILGYLGVILFLILFIPIYRDCNPILYLQYSYLLNNFCLQSLHKIYNTLVLLFATRYTYRAKIPLIL